MGAATAALTVSATATLAGPVFLREDLGRCIEDSAMREETLDAMLHLHEEVLIRVARAHVHTEIAKAARRGA